MKIGDTKIGGLKLLMRHERPDLRDAGAVDVEVTSEIELILDVGNTTVRWHGAALHETSRTEGKNERE